MTDTFIDPRNLEAGFTEICPGCKQIKASDFRVSDSVEIINAGFKKDEYK